MNNRYTLLVTLPDGAFLGTAHYASKAAMLSDLAAYIASGYSVEAMAYSLWKARCEES